MVVIASLCVAGLSGSAVHPPQAVFHCPDGIEKTPLATPGAKLWRAAIPCSLLRLLSFAVHRSSCGQWSTGLMTLFTPSTNPRPDFIQTPLATVCVYCTGKRLRARRLLTASHPLHLGSALLRRVPRSTE
ncbi:hypothetical protein C8Q78DRAFT_51417 [Trametes maxima]|nr:hypothetical protein C8Q78DRAFT_51417 [Trametes maxima]